MTAFAVYGVVYSECLAQAKKNVPATIKKDGNIIELTQEEWIDAVKAIAEKSFKSSKPKKISIQYDAPQFCRDFIDLLAKQRHRDCQIYCAKKEAVIRKGKKIIRTIWVPMDDINTKHQNN